MIVVGKFSSFLMAMLIMGNFAVAGEMPDEVRELA
jgi:hypothetical protein